MHAERQLDFAVAADFGDGRVQRAQEAHAAIVAEPNVVADSEPLGWPRESAPAALVDALVQIERDARFGFATSPLALQRSAYHTGVVENERVTGPEKVWKIADDAIFEPTRAHHQQLRPIARRYRLKRDTAVGQLEVEQVGAHEPSIGGSTA